MARESGGSNVEGVEAQGARARGQVERKGVTDVQTQDAGQERTRILPETRAGTRPREQAGACAMAFLGHANQAPSPKECTKGGMARDGVWRVDQSNAAGMG
jgi:hypothetical protein